MSNTRPSSSMSNASSAAPRGTVATSRRGGRTRSRSPPNSMSRPGSVQSHIEQHGVGGMTAEGRKSPGNPSSAAAAAAAAAKAISGGGGRQSSSWYEGGDDPSRGHRDSREPPRGQHGYDYASSRKWPTEDMRDRRGYMGGQSHQMPSREMGDERVHLQYTRRGPHDREAPPMDGYNHAQHPPPQHRQPNMEHGRYYEQRPMDYDPRYGGRREHYDQSHGLPPQTRGRPGESSRPSTRGPPPPHGPPHGPGGPYDDRLRYDRRPPPPHAEEYYKGGPMPAPVNKPNGAKFRQYSPKPSISTREMGPSQVKSSSGAPGGGNGGHTRVIGTATPIHVPRAPDPPRSHHQAGNPSSVFRDRPSVATADAGRRSPDDESPQKILMSLRTPTSSFEERPGSKTAENRKKQANSGPPLSPEEPPQIQHTNQAQIDQNIFFDRSPSTMEGRGTTGATLEMAPSFNLFNQSFDSLGDAANYFTNVGGSLDIQSSSFGAPLGVGSTDNNDATLPDTLQRGSSGVTSLVGGDRGILGSHSVGMLTFGMSPVNSFGNGAPSSSNAATATATNSGTASSSQNNGSGNRSATAATNGGSSNSRRGNMMILGGSDARSQSPSQMMSMYPTYSSGYDGRQPGHSAPFRTRSGQQHNPPGDHPVRTMSAGSGYAAPYNRSYEASPRVQYPGHMGQDASRPFEGPPGFYVFLARHKGAFIGCTFLLPGLKASLLESPLGSDPKKLKDEKKMMKKSPPPLPGSFPEPSPQDTETAKRRVMSAVCAFGGSISGDRGTHHMKDNKKDATKSIFRDKDGDKAATVTPSSSAGSSSSSRGISREKIKYDEMLPTRYYENENRLSWEFEETPPVGIMEREEEARKRKRAEERDVGSRVSSPSPKPLNSASIGKKGAKEQEEQPKMRYRCKLCGQPKQNHTCPFQQSLQRSIGTMVYPAVNAFTSNEPGLLAPALSDMNNFITGHEISSSTESSPNRPTPDRRRGAAASTPVGGVVNNVTPETLRSTGGSPAASSLSTGSGGSPFRTPASKRKRDSANLSGGVAISRRVGASTTTPSSANSRKRHQPGSVEENPSDLLFVDTQELKPEQFRIVSPAKAPTSDSYTYPALPLPYAQRKRLSDNLFALSKEVPKLTDECAVVLREAREKDMWDLAVAELMTQVVVVIHCRDGDTRFEGLRRYLLTLGIAC